MQTRPELVDLGGEFGILMQFQPEKARRAGQGEVVGGGTQAADKHHAVGKFQRVGERSVKILRPVADGERGVELRPARRKLAPELRQVGVYGTAAQKFGAGADD